jgi:hypothetical protein
VDWWFPCSCRQRLEEVQAGGIMDKTSMYEAAGQTR